MSEMPTSASTNEERGCPPGRGAAYPGTPRWVKVGALVAGVLVSLVVLVMLVAGGEHGPMRHLPSAGFTNTSADIAGGL
jgi:hypothetical protein